MISLIGGSAYSTTGGIQTFNRGVVKILHKQGALRKAHFLWDDWATTSDTYRVVAQRLPVCFYAVGRLRFVGNLVWSALRHPGDRWLVAHINYLVLAFVINAFLRRKVVLMLYAAELDEKQSWLTMLLLRYWAPRVVAISEFTKRKAVKLGLPSERIAVVPLGMLVDRPAVMRVPRGVDAPVRFLFVGRMDERYKGQMEILDALQVLAGRSISVRVDFVGGGTSLDFWRNEQETRGLQHQVSFHGVVSQQRLEKFFAEADVLVMPSQNEGFGLVYVEAMSISLPCIASNVDAAKEVVLDGITGCCVPFGNSTALAGAIETLARDAQLRQRLGRAGEQRYRDYYTRECFEERFLQLLRNCAWIKLAEAV